MNTKILGYVMMAGSAAIAAFSFMPYGWSHIVAGSLGAALLALHSVPTASAIASKVNGASKG